MSTRKLVFFEPGDRAYVRPDHEVAHLWYRRGRVVSVSATHEVTLRLDDGGVNDGCFVTIPAYRLATYKPRPYAPRAKPKARKEAIKPEYGEELTLEAGT